MGLNLDQIGQEKTRWLPLQGHLAGVEIQIRFVGTEDSQKFHSRMEADGIIRVTREDPMHINAGREAAFFKAIAARYVVDWREDEAWRAEHPDAPPAISRNGPKGTAFDVDDMASVLRFYPSAYRQLMSACAEEDAFFVNGHDGSTTS